MSNREKVWFFIKSLNRIGETIGALTDAKIFAEQASDPDRTFEDRERLMRKVALLIGVEDVEP